MSSHEHVNTVIATTATYTTSAGLVAGGYLKVLNDNAPAFGVAIAAITFLVNLWFQIINRRARLNQLRHDIIEEIEEINREKRNE